MFAKNAVPAILSPQTRNAIVTINNTAAVLKAINGRITHSALATQDTNAAQVTLTRLTPNAVHVIQPRSAALKIPFLIRVFANHA
jgi:hypothetical protein